MLHPPEYPLQGFGGKPIKPVGKISLRVSFGDLDNARTENLTFDVVDIYHPYLAIFGRGQHSVRQSTRGQKHRKGTYP
jgi:hypothetical protein